MPSYTRDEITDTNARYHNAIADEFDARLEGHHPAVLEFYRTIFERDVFPRLPSSGEVRCIDFGCGAGYLEQFLTRPLSVTGIDVADKLLARARERYPSMTFIQGDLYTHPFPEKVHLTIENGVLHHLLDYEALIDRMAELTLPGGVLFLGNEPNRAAYRYLAPLKFLYRHTIARARTRNVEEKTGDRQLEELSEYHLFKGSGFDAAAIRDRLRRHGFDEVRFYFSLRELFAAMQEQLPALKLNDLVPRAVLDHFPLSRNFSVVAIKRS